MPKRSSKYALGVLPCGGADRFSVLVDPCPDSPTIDDLAYPTSAPLLGGRAGEPGGLGPNDLARE